MVRSSQICHPFMRDQRTEYHLCFSNEVTSMRVYLVRLNGAEYICGLFTLRDDKIMAQAGCATRKFKDLQVSNFTHGSFRFGFDTLGIRCISIGLSEWAPLDPESIGAYQGHKLLAPSSELRITTDVLQALALSENYLRVGSILVTCHLLIYQPPQRGRQRA